MLPLHFPGLSRRHICVASRCLQMILSSHILPFQATCEPQISVLRKDACSRVLWLPSVHLLPAMAALNNAVPVLVHVLLYKLREYVFPFMVVSLHMKVVIGLWLVHHCSAMINSTRSKWLLGELATLKARVTQVLKGLVACSIDLHAEIPISGEKRAKSNWVPATFLVRPISNEEALAVFGHASIGLERPGQLLLVSNGTGPMVDLWAQSLGSNVK
ncbi:hypothetical protein VNO77_24339 [Canavalia gladiata]|uniref:Uncharacterized protein n=1 Tax=Canavalia gladiata TaxID=3824 RepID=A0AAN9QG54_CANGL